MKNCPECKTEDLNKFGKHLSRKDGLRKFCKECQNKINRISYKKNHESIRKVQANYYKNNKERLDLINKRWAQNNKEAILYISRKWRKNHSDEKNAFTAKRRASRFRATPKWLTKQQFLEIKHFYTLVKELQWLSNERLEVDHIVPLQGKNVCGLHVPWNLQILPKSLNILKSNRL